MIGILIVAHGTLGVWLIAYAEETQYVAMQESFARFRDGLSLGKGDTNSPPPAQRSHRSKSGRFLFSNGL